MKIENGTYVPKEEIKNQEMLDNVVAAFKKFGFQVKNSYNLKIDLIKCCKGLGIVYSVIDDGLFIWPVNQSALNSITYNELMELAGMNEEWPKIGDEVTWGNKSFKGEIKAIDDDMAWIKSEYGNYIGAHISVLDKPKTPEQLLREDIEKTLSGNPSLDYGIDMLLEKFNVTRK